MSFSMIEFAFCFAVAMSFLMIEYSFCFARAVTMLSSMKECATERLLRGTDKLQDKETACCENQTKVKICWQNC